MALLSVIVDDGYGVVVVKFISVSFILQHELLKLFPLFFSFAYRRVFTSFVVTMNRKN